MRTLFLFIVLGAFPFDSCFLNRFADTTVFAGYLAIPISQKDFVLLNNEVVRSRLYYDNHYHDYSSYREFLEDLMNHPGTIDLFRDLKLSRTEHHNCVLQTKARRNFSSFKKKYLECVFLDSDTYQIKKKYLKKEKQILKVCFDFGYYLYWDDVAAQWIITSRPRLKPPLNDEPQFDNSESTKTIGLH